jgi:hypothetical protein
MELTQDNNMMIERGILEKHKLTIYSQAGQSERCESVRTLTGVR